MEATPGGARLTSRAVVDLSHFTDEQLAADAAREGSDGPAFVALLGRHQERVFRLCYRLLGNAEDAADAAQEVCVRLFLQRASFRGESKYTTWLHGVTVRTCLTLRRGRGRRQKREAVVRDESAEHPRTDESASSTELKLDLGKMLDVLDEEDRALLILKYAEGYDYEELAGMFRLGVSACKMRISRAREKLQQLFPAQNFLTEE